MYPLFYFRQKRLLNKNKNFIRQLIFKQVLKIVQFGLGRESVLFFRIRNISFENVF